MTEPRSPGRSEPRRQSEVGRRIRAVLGRIFLYLVMVFVLAISILPLVWVLVTSFKSNQEILSSALTLPKVWSFHGYVLAVQLAKLQLKFLTSMIVATCTTVGSLLIYSMAAYVLARTRFRLKGVVFTLLISSILIPVNTMVQPVYEIIRRLGLYDTKAALILVNIGFALPLCLFLLRSFLLSLPVELEEAAYIEGASFPRTFWRIIFPLAQPALTSAGVLTFLGTWNELLYALLLTSSERNRVLPLAIRYFTQQFTFDYSAMFAALVLYIVPSLIIYIILQNQIMEGLVAGAVKE
ncbi:MAG TPA: carbohydrate ABC transporter permease [Spirochaetia bacterium]|nr:carbohydrate ABC transporter permease [Spirochaetia bacterium]